VAVLRTYGFAHGLVKATDNMLQVGISRMDNQREGWNDHMLYEPIAMTYFCRILYESMSIRAVFNPLAAACCKMKSSHLVSAKGFLKSRRL
jgi:hypothetical protein